MNTECVASISARFSDILRENYPHLCGNLSHLRTSSSYILTHCKTFCNSFFKIFYLFLCRNERFFTEIFCAKRTKHGQNRSKGAFFECKIPAKSCLNGIFGGYFSDIYRSFLYTMPVFKTFSQKMLHSSDLFSRPHGIQHRNHGRADICDQRKLHGRHHRNTNQRNSDLHGK